jgi:hypothetical protein
VAHDTEALRVGDAQFNDLVHPGHHDRHQVSHAIASSCPVLQAAADIASFL